MSARPPVLVDIKFNPEGVARVLKTAFADRGSINLADPGHQARDLRAVE
jgi:glyoxylate/hydroxypyruvate reductase A